MRYVKIILAILALPWVIHNPVHAAQESERESLRGLLGVEVLVENIRPDAQADGLSQSQIQTDAELILRTSGIRVLTREEPKINPRAPYLYIAVHTFKNRELYAFNIRIELKQLVSIKDLKTNKLIFGSTWDVSYVGTVGKDNLTTLRNFVDDYVKRFANDFLAMNPR